MSQRFQDVIKLERQPRISQRLKLECEGCGRRHTYDVGTMFHWQEGEGKSAKPQYAFANYFRCRECGAAGPWKIADYLRLLGPVLTAVARGVGNQRFMAVQPVLFDGTSHQTSAMGEEHLLRLIGKEPRNAFLHTRLGNLLRTCGETARSVEWFEKAVALDPGDVEARYNLLNFAVEAIDIPAVLARAPLLVRHLLAGRTTNKEDLTEGIAYFVAQVLRQLPEIRAECPPPRGAAAASPEWTFVRTLLDQSGDEKEIVAEAAERLLCGEPAPEELGLEVVEADGADDALKPVIDLVPSLREVVEREGLDAQKLTVALGTDNQERITVKDRHAIPVTDGRKVGIWRVPSLRDLTRGRKPPPPDMAHYPQEFVGHFFSVEKHVLTICETQGEPTDQELESIYGALRRRPDGKCLLGTTQEFLWQAAALMVGKQVVSEAEYQAIMGRLERSARTWACRPVSRNYVTYLRDNLQRR